MQRAGALACQSTPLVSGSGELLGMLSTHYERPHEPLPEELQVVDLVARVASRWLSGAVA
jgi:GAF domain-containing protein